MARRIRFAPPGCTVEVTCRTLQSRFFMTPETGLEEIILGIIGRAQHLTGMRIYGYAFLSNHFHLILGPASVHQLARFMCFVNSNIAREVGRRCLWHARFWSRRYQAILISDEDGAQEGRFRYLMSHGSKEGLVLSPRDWPGVHCVRALLTGEPDIGVWFDRTKEYNARRRGLTVSSYDFATLYPVILSPLPCWAHLDSCEYRRRIEELVADIEREARVQAEATGRKPLGTARLRNQDPHMRPRSTARRPAPLVHAVGAEARHLLVSAYRRFVACYRAAASRLARGDLGARFPDNCFPPPWRGELENSLPSQA